MTQKTTEAIPKASANGEAPKVGDVIDTIPYSGGTIEIVNFQASQIMAAAAAAKASGLNDPDDIIYVMLGQVSQVNGKPGSYDSVLDLPQPVITRMTESITPGITDKKADETGFSGNLPSGRGCHWRVPTGRDTKKAQKAYGADGVNFGLIELCVTIEGEPVLRMDAELMDGRDYMSLLNEMMAFPS